MEEVEKFLSFINEKTCNKFEFVQLKQVFFDVNKNKLSVFFNYSSENELNDEGKNQIVQAVRDYIPLNCQIEVQFSKCYLEEDLVLNQIKKFLQDNYQMLLTGLDKNSIKIDCDNKTVSFNLEHQIYTYFLNANISKQISSHLKLNFCANFEVCATDIGSKQVKEAFLGDRMEQIKAESELNMIKTANKNRFVVEDKKLLIGKEITVNPRWIASIDRCVEDCVLAGNIQFLTEKTFTSKRTKKNKDGTEEPIIKPMFRFQLKDKSGTISCVHFPTKESYHKMHLLKNGDMVVVQGQISQYNDNFDMNAKSISLCVLPQNNSTQILTNVEQITNYRYVSPHPFTTSRQADMFEERHLSKEVSTQSFVVYDFETTGINPTSDQIVEIGALKIVNGQFKEVFTTLVKPTIPIPPEATKVNRITNEMVKNCYSIEQILPDFYLFCKDCQMVGYNSIAFDYLFLDFAAKKIGIKFDNTQLDVFLMAKQKLKGLNRYNLSAVSKYLDISLIDAHRALNDVLATAEVFLKLY